MPLHTPVTILLMDDEPVFVRALALLLRRDGATVDTAAHGHGALTLLLQRRYDLLLCDLRMPDLDGPAFYDILTSQYPHLRSRVIFLTGDTLRAESLTFLDQCGQPWLAKPCTMGAIRSAMAQVLRATVPAPTRQAEGWQ
jgi:CheY-like chemotaxis protein